MKAELSKFNRIKRDENSEVLNSIRQQIATRIQSEFEKEAKNIKAESDALHDEEKKFKHDACKILSSITCDTKVRVVTQTGKGSLVLNNYEGYLNNKFKNDDCTFDFVSANAYGGKPFTIGLSCLQSIEVIE